MKICIQSKTYSNLGSHQIYLDTSYLKYLFQERVRPISWPFDHSNVVCAIWYCFRKIYVYSLSLTVCRDVGYILVMLQYFVSLHISKGTMQTIKNNLTNATAWAPDNLMILSN